MSFLPAFPSNKLPPQAQEVFFLEMLERDMATGRRVAIFLILWRERYLTRENLIARVEQKLGKGCFGISAWEDTFYRDMRVVKKAFQEAGFVVAYSRARDHPGYYLLDQPPLHPDLALAIRGSIGELDFRQLEIYHSHKPAERVRQGCSITDTARRVGAYRQQKREANE